MVNPHSAKYRNLLLGLSVIVLGLGALSAMDVRNLTYTGFQTDGNNKVINVERGGPAAAAGLQVGDVLSSVNGVAVSDTKGVSNQRRADVGAGWPYVVRRGTQTVNLTITQAPLPPTYGYVRRAGTLLGLCYLGFTLWAYIAAPGAATTLLALVGQSFGLVFLNVPYFESPLVRIAVTSMVLVVITLGIAALVHFLLAFPTRRPFLNRPFGTTVLYGPAIAVGLIFAGFTILRPDSSSAINIFLRTAANLVFAGYFLAATILVFRRYFSATPTDRAAHGLGLMLAGVIVGLGPLLAAGIVALLSPSTFLPLSQFYFLTLGLIPIAFATAAVRSARAGG